MDFESVLDLFTFCNIIILMNVLDPRTYEVGPIPQRSRKSGSELWEKHDLNTIPAMERYQMAHARGLCFDILHWFFTTHELFDKETSLPINGFNDVAMTYLAHQGSVILAYKRQASVDECTTPCQANDVDRQLHLCFQNYSEIPQVLPTTMKDHHSTLLFPEPHKYFVRKLDNPKSYSRKHLRPRGPGRQWLTSSLEF